MLDGARRSRHEWVAAMDNVRTMLGVAGLLVLFERIHMHVRGQASDDQRSWADVTRETMKERLA